MSKEKRPKGHYVVKVGAKFVGNERFLDCFGKWKLTSNTGSVLSEAQNNAYGPYIRKRTATPRRPRKVGKSLK